MSAVPGARVNTLLRLRDRLTIGTQLTCVENTYMPSYTGDVRVLTGIGRSFVNGTAHGRLAVVQLPTHAADVEWLDGDTVRWPLGDPDRRPALAGHTVTYRIAGPAPLPQGVC